MNLVSKETIRGEILMNGKHYFAVELGDFHQKNVLVEVVSEQQIKVFDESGVFICTADLDECKATPFPAMCGKPILKPNYSEVHNEKPRT
mgnify:CR=1 FL=1